MRGAMLGRVWIHNPATHESCAIKKTESIPDGFVTGRDVSDHREKMKALYEDLYIKYKSLHYDYDTLKSGNDVLKKLTHK